MDSLFVYRKIDLRQSEECFHFRGEYEPALDAGVEKRLLAGAVARQDELSVRHVPQGNGKHAA